MPSQQFPEDQGRPVIVRTFQINDSNGKDLSMNRGDGFSVGSRMNLD